MLRITSLITQKNVDPGAIPAHIREGSKRFEEQQVSET
jgi:hypothetical protein